MANLWIRNRGRIDGPFTLDRVEGLLRRGRIGRHCHISLNKSDWQSADEFLRNHQKDRGDVGDFEENDFSVELPDDFAPTALDSQFGSSVFDVDEGEEDGDSSDDWPARPRILIRHFLSLRKHAASLLAMILTASLLMAAWRYFRETWGQDSADLAVLTQVVQRISVGHSVGATGDVWLQLEADAERDAAPIISRLSHKASAQDHVKQELLFAARDDIPLMIEQLPKDNHDASRRVMLRFERVREMIASKKRQHMASILAALPELPKAPAMTNPPDESQVTEKIEMKGVLQELRSQVGTQREQLNELFSEGQRSSDSQQTLPIPGRPQPANLMSFGQSLN
ncbi:MAG: hypothetical protein R3C59_10235 [Planctomycetaceae bacterium]